MLNFDRSQFIEQGEELMQIALAHGTDKQTAIKKIDGFLDELMRREFPGGVAIKEPKKQWDGDRMGFSFKAKKGFFGTTIGGRILVTDNQVMLDSELPGMVTAFVDEDKIRAVITDQFNDLFGLKKK